MMQATIFLYLLFKACTNNVNEQVLKTLEEISLNLKPRKFTVL